MKTKRQDAILRLISENDIQTQEELIRMLNAEGFNTTQATVSRDIRDLKLVKSRSGNVSKYSLPVHTEIIIGAKYQNILHETVTSVDSTSVFAVLKTYPGMANAACAAIDGLDLSDVLGTLAGDDTILVICRTEEEATELSAKLRQIIKEI